MNAKVERTVVKDFSEAFRIFLYHDPKFQFEIVNVKEAPQLPEFEMREIFN